MIWRLGKSYDPEDSILLEGVAQGDGLLLILMHPTEGGVVGIYLIPAQNTAFLREAGVEEVEYDS